MTTKQDPIFALIAAHRIATAGFDRVVGEYSRLETKYGVSKNFPAAVEKAHNRRYEAASRAKSKAMRALSNTRATTPEGFAALFAHLLPELNEMAEGHYADGCWNNLFKTMSKAAHGFAAPARGKVLPFIAPRRKAA